MTEAKQEMYAGLGHLFYSIAASDGRVEAEEASKLKALVKRHWIPGEHGQDEAGSDLAYYIEIGFDHANDAGLDARAAFNRFKETFFATKELFDASTRNLATRTAQAVADAYEGRSQQEKRILELLKEVFTQ